MNFSAIPEASRLGKILRWPLRLLPGSMRLPIMQGRLRGKRWIVGSGNHGYWLGSYESNKLSIFEKYAHPGGVVYDVGAHVGYYTLYAATLVGPTGKVIAFEPLPRNINFLKEHLRINHISNVKVVEAAVSNHNGISRFSSRFESSMGRLAGNGNLIVDTVCLDDLWKRAELPAPQVVKIDVEGAEFSVLAGGSQLFQEKRPVIFLSIHGAEIRDQCAAWFLAAGYHWSMINSLDELLVIPDDDRRGPF